MACRSDPDLVLEVVGTSRDLFASPLFMIVGATGGPGPFWVVGTSRECNVVSFYIRLGFGDYNKVVSMAIPMISSFDVLWVVGQSFASRVRVDRLILECIYHASQLYFLFRFFLRTSVLVVLSSYIC